MRGVRLGVLLFAWGIVGAHLSLGAQTVGQIVFLPQTFYVGDVVEARVVVRTSESLDIVVPPVLPDREWVDFRSVYVVQRADGYEVRIVFQPFFVGARQLPRLDLGSVVLPEISVVVHSLTEEGEISLQPVREQQLLPGTRPAIAIIVLVLLGAPVLIGVTSGWVRGRLQRVSLWYRRGRPYRHLQRGMKRLKNEMMELDGKRYYIELLDLARDYLSGRFGAPFRAATTGELSSLLVRQRVPGELTARIVALFAFGDLVKFANQAVTVEDRTTHAAELLSVSAEFQHLAKEAGRVDT